MIRLVLASAALALAAQSPLARSHVLIVSGVAGEPQYGDAFHATAMAMITAAQSRLGVADSDIVYLAERPDRDRARIKGVSNKAGIEQAMSALADRAKPGDVVLVMLIGHGSSQDGTARFNVPGPDITATDFARLLEPLKSQKVAFVNAASASGDFLPVLSGENRVIVTATKSGFERNETTFAQHFVSAFARDGADGDKDGRVSILEAFDFARQEVARGYEQGNRLQTEHAMLDDNGDKVGVAKPDPKAGDGLLARRLFLSPGRAAAVAAASNDPRALALVRERDSLTAQLDSLRRRKEAMDSVAYERALERILVELASKNQEIRALEGRKP